MPKKEKKEKKEKKAAVVKRKEKVEAVAVEAEPMTPSQEIVAIGVGEMGIKPFPDPDKMTSMERLEFIREKNTSRIQDEFELAYALWTAMKNKDHVNQGYEWTDFVQEQCGLSHAKANQLITMWDRLVAVGVDNVKKMLNHSWYKVKLLGPAIEKSKINRRNIESWMERCLIGGDKALKADVLEAMIKGLIKEAKGDKLDTGPATVKYVIPKYDVPTIEQFESIARANLKTEDRGACLINAAIEYSTNHANAQDAQVWRARGLAAMKELAERVAPVVALYVPTDPNQNTQEALGVLPFTTIYQGFSEESGERALHYCIASSEAEAKAFMKVKQVRDFKIEIAPSLQPKIAYQAPPPETPPEAKDGKEPAKEEKEPKPAKGKKGKAKAKEPEAKTEETKTEGKAKGKKKPAAPELTANQKKALAMSDEEAKASVMVLIRKLSIAKEAYNKKKVELQSELPPGLTSTQAMAAWLMDQDK